MTQKDLFTKDPSSSQADIPASPSAQAVKEPVKKILATSSRTLQKLLHKQDPLTAFSRMFMDTFRSASTRYLAKWDHLITPHRHLLFQLRVSAPTKETDSGSSARTWPTPTTKGFGHASEGQTLIMRDLVERGELTEEEAQAMMNGTTLRPPRMKEWDYPKPRRFAPTPTASDHIERVSTSTEKMNPLTGKSVSLDRFVKFWPTQEIQKSGKPEMWPTPTAMDNKEDALKHATKLLQGKTHRSSGQPIQKTLSDKVMMDLIIKHPELMELYQDHQMEERPNLPPQQEFVDYLRLQTTIKDLSEKTNIKKTTIEHWFRKDDKGFSYPSIENWEQIKPHLKEIKYDKEMTTLESKEWTKKNQEMWPTPRTQAGSRPNGKGGKVLEEEVLIASGQRIRGMTLKEQQMWPTPTTQETEHPNMKLNEKGRRVSPKGKESHSLNLADKVQMWPTPRASIGMNMSLSEKMATLRHKRYLETEMAYQIQKENPHKTTAKLSPAFVEYLMGFPDGWTNPDISNEQLIRMNTEQKD